MMAIQLHELLILLTSSTQAQPSSILVGTLAARYMAVKNIAGPDHCWGVNLFVQFSAAVASMPQEPQRHI
jgi:hypothetical protein